MESRSDESSLSDSGQRSEGPVVECPTCKGDIAVDAFTRVGARPQFGLADCQCSTYPIVAGVLVLRTDALASVALKQVRSGRFEEATATLLNRDLRELPLRSALGDRLANAPSLEAPFHRLAARYVGLASRLEAAGIERARDARSYEAAVEELMGYDAPEWYVYPEYLRYRPIVPNFWNLYAHLPIVAENGGPILDYGGGIGHVSSLLSRLFGTSVYNVDIDYPALYLYTRFMEAETMGVLIEPGTDLPFARDAFGTVLDVDTFTQVENKYSLAAEYERVRADSGRVIVVHMQTELSWSDQTLTPAEYRDAFPGRGITTCEAEIVDAFLDGERAVVFRDSIEDARHGDALNYLYPVDTQEVTARPEDNPLFAWDDPVSVNPLYRWERQGDAIHLERGRPSEEFVDVYPQSFAETERRYDVDLADPIPRDLLKRGVLTPLPAYDGRPLLSFGGDRSE